MSVTNTEHPDTGRLFNVEVDATMLGARVSMTTSFDILPGDAVAPGGIDRPAFVERALESAQIRGYVDAYGRLKAGLG